MVEVTVDLTPFYSPGLTLKKVTDITHTFLLTSSIIYCKELMKFKV